MRRITARELDLNLEDIDGISFSIDDDTSTKNKTHWNFSIMTLREDRTFDKNDIGYMYQIVLYNEKSIEVFEAVLGDLDYYVKNLLNINQQGLIIKKCSKSQEIFQKLFKGKFTEALERGIILYDEEQEA